LHANSHPKASKSLLPHEASLTVLYRPKATSKSKSISVPRVFELVKACLGVPSVVVYNGKQLHLKPTTSRRQLRFSAGAYRKTNPPEDPFSTSLEDIKLSILVSFESQYVAAQETLKCFAGLPESTPKTFIFTGNALNQTPLAPVFPFSLAQRTAATLIEYGANAYGSKRYR